jgi:acetoacetyl-CoA synthetase
MMEASHSAPIWVPGTDYLTISPMAHFRELGEVRARRSFSSYSELHDWSVDRRTAGDFWMLLFEFLVMGESITFEWVSGQNLYPILSIGSDQNQTAFREMFPSPTWFPEARLNFAGSLSRAKSDPTNVAFIKAQESSLKPNNITWGELYAQVEKRTDALRSLGVLKGDRVAAVIGNTEHSISLCLATLSLGGYLVFNTSGLRRRWDSRSFVTDQTKARLCG